MVPTLFLRGCVTTGPKARRPAVSALRVFSAGASPPAECIADGDLRLRDADLVNDEASRSRIKGLIGWPSPAGDAPLK